MKIYVAGKFEDKERVRYVQQSLRNMGHEITFDWTPHDATGKSGDELWNYLSYCALEDLKGARDCDLIFLISHPAGKASMSEFGIAAAMDRQLLVVDSPGVLNIFFHLPKVKRVATLDEGLDYVASITKIVVT